jgi:hypothetical protein
MATRFYLPSSGTPGVSPSIVADWEHVNTLRRPMSPTPAVTAFSTTTYTPDTLDHLVNQDAHVCQFVSEPLAAQSIPAQTLQIVIRVAEAHASNNLFLTWKVYLVDSAGTVGSTILAIRRDGSEMPTSLTNRQDTATSAAVTAVDGDRIVLEVGFGGTPSASGGVQGHNGSMRFGDASATDLVAADTGTLDDNPWFQFATTTLVFALAPVTASDAAGVGEQAADLSAGHTRADAGVGSETSTPTAALAGTDALAGAEVASVVTAALTATDGASLESSDDTSIPTTGAGGLGGGELAFILQATLVSAADTQAVADAAALLVALPLVDAATETADTSLAAALESPDEAAAADVSEPLAALLPAADEAALSDDGSAISLALADDGAVTDISETVVALVADDTAALSEAAEPVIPVATADSVAVADASEPLIAALEAGDDAAATDTSALIVALAAADDGAAEDASALAVQEFKTAADAGAVSEFAAQIVPVGAADTATLADASTLAAVLAGADTAAGAESSELFAPDGDISRPGQVGVTAIPTGSATATALLTGLVGATAEPQEVTA